MGNTYLILINSKVSRALHGKKELLSLFESWLSVSVCWVAFLPCPPGWARGKGGTKWDTFLKGTGLVVLEHWSPPMDSGCQLNWPTEGSGPSVSCMRGRYRPCSRSRGLAFLSQLWPPGAMAWASPCRSQLLLCTRKGFRPAPTECPRGPVLGMKS